MTKIVLFGGAFDPPHVGHTLVIRQALAQVKPDTLWLMPCYEHTFGKSLAPVKERLALTRLLAESMHDERVTVSDVELVHKTSGSTYETWQVLTKEHPKTEFYFLMGSDNLSTFPKWREWRKLLKAMRFYVYLRAGHPPRPWYEGMRLLHSPEVSHVSSSDIRKRLTVSEGIGDLVPDKVVEYIREKRLYR
jgi:nicotinate-nucleotide adenylyltransferase